MSNEAQEALTLDALNGAVVMNPEAIGNPDEAPQVFLGGDLARLLRPCVCGGVNGFHGADCQRLGGVS